MASFPYDEKFILYTRIRQPLREISCQRLLASKDSNGGWLRKRYKKRKWRKVFVVLHKGCVYYFEDELSNDALESMSLFGIDRAQAATEIPLDEALWSFKLVHLHVDSFRPQYLCAASGKELHKWMNDFENEIKKANRTEDVNRNEGEDNYYSMPSTGNLNVPPRPSTPPPPPPPPPPRRKPINNDYRNLHFRPRPSTPPPPTLIPRTNRNNDLQSTYLLLTDSSSEEDYEECDSNYENTTDQERVSNENITEEYYTDVAVPAVCPDKVWKNQDRKVCFHAMALFDYEAEENDELSFCSGQIITVTDLTSDGWWFGKLKEDKGLFPSNYVKRINYKDHDDVDYACLDHNSTSTGVDGDRYQQLVAVNKNLQTRSTEGNQKTPDENTYNSYWNHEGRHRCNLEQLIPEKLKRLDRNSVEIYLNHLRSGKERPNKIRIVIIGQKSAGKSSLTRRLLKETINDVQSTNGVEKHSFKCRALITDGQWIFNGCTYEEDLDRRLLKSCIEQCKNDNNEEVSDGYLSNQASKESGILQAPFCNIDNKSSTSAKDSNDQNLLDEHADDATEYYDLYDVLSATIDVDETAPVEILDFAGDTEHINTHHIFFRDDAIYVVVTNVMEEIIELDNDTPRYGLAFWLETIRCHCDTQHTDVGKYREPPILVIGTHKDMFEGNESECKMQLEYQVQELVRNSEIRRNIAGLYVVSNTDDSESVYESLHRDIVDIAKKRRKWNTELPARWIHLEKKLQQLETPVVGKAIIFELAASIVQPIQDKDEIERFLNYHHEVGTYVYYADLPDNVVLNPQWLANAFKCIITADHFQGDIVNEREWQKFRKSGRLSHQLIEIIFSKQDTIIQEWKELILGIMKKFYIIGRPKSEIMDSDYYVPCMIKRKNECNIDEEFLNCSKTSSLCAVFDFLPPPFMSKLLVACIDQYKVARVPENDEWHPAFYKDFAIFDLDETASAKMLIARHGNAIFVQILIFGEHEKRSFKDVKDKIVDLLEELKQDRFHMNISYSLMFKCKYTENESHVGMVGFEVIKSQRDYLCEEHRNTHKSDEIYFDWFGEIEQNNFTGEQINATRMSIIIVEILTDALYDLLLQDVGIVKPRVECDITFLYASHRKNGKHVPSKGWGSTFQWDGIQNHFQLVGDDIERIRLVRNEMAHSKKFAMDDNKYYKMCNTVLKLLQRMEKQNGKGNQYSARMKEVKLKETNMTEYRAYEKKIVTELPRLKMKQSFKVTAGEGCTLECEIVVPLPKGSIIKWIKTSNEVEKLLEVNETTKHKYGGAEVNYPSLNILNTIKDDEGYYSCQIEYPPESAESNYEHVVWPKTFLHVK